MTDLDAIEARANAATEGPWRIDGNRTVGAWSVFGPGERAENFVACVVDRIKLDSERNDKERRQRDGDFIAHARTDIPAMVKELREQAAEIARLQAELSASNHARLGLTLATEEFLAGRITETAMRMTLDAAIDAARKET